MTSVYVLYENISYISLGQKRLFLVHSTFFLSSLYAPHDVPRSRMMMMRQAAAEKLIENNDV